jgi:hypothetical protein
LAEAEMRAARTLETLANKIDEYNASIDDSTVAERYSFKEMVPVKVGK